MLAVAAAACCRCPLHSTCVFRYSRQLCSYLDARDPALARLRQLSHSPAAWFRCPFAHVVLVSCLEVGAAFESLLTLSSKHCSDQCCARSCLEVGAARAPAEPVISFAAELKQHREQLVMHGLFWVHYAACAAA